MALRDYQRAAVGAVLTKWQEFDRLLGVAPIGSGKTIKFANHKGTNGFGAGVSLGPSRRAN
jgi:hypothetical protein